MARHAGSSYAWEKFSQEANANNIVPMEIALRCVNAIRRGERFAAYIMIPLHPERPGPQRPVIMQWTWLSISFMFRCSLQPPRTIPCMLCA